MNKTNLLNNVFNVDGNELIKTNSKYLKIFIVIIIILICLLFIIKKNIYYENIIVEDGSDIIIYASKSEVNAIKEKDTIIIDGIKDNYSIKSIDSKDDICLLYIKLTTTISNLNNKKYQILLGKETIIQYIIRIIKKK